MRLHNIEQILGIVLAVAISLYIWLGGYAFIIYGVVAIAALVLYILQRPQKQKRAESKPTTMQSADLKQLSDQIVAGRREQGRKLLAVAEQIKAERAEYSRMIERLLDWYLEYLRDNGIYHNDLYQYLLTRIKDRQKQAKAPYLKRELNQSKVVVRAIMRGEQAQKIIERLESEQDGYSQE